MTIGDKIESIPIEVVIVYVVSDKATSDMFHLDTYTILIGRDFNIV